MFKKYKLIKTIPFNSTNRIFLTGFEEVVVNNKTTYYIINQDIVLLFDQNWTKKSEHKLPRMCYCLKYISGYFYITSYSMLFKTDSNFNEISRYDGKRPYLLPHYWGIHYDGSLLYVVSRQIKCIDVLNTNLTLIRIIYFDRISEPYSINQFNGIFYVGCVDNKVLTIQNDKISNKYDIYKCKGIYSIYFDIYGDMTVTCFKRNITRLYNYKGNNKRISKEGKEPTYLAVDSLERLIIIYSQSIQIYYNKII